MTTTRTATRDRVTAALNRDAITSAFQPIADLRSGSIVGFEALARFDDGMSPARWFSEAASVGLGIDLEIAAIRAALPHMEDLLADRYLSVNVSPELAVSPRLLEALAGTKLDRIVIEITEHTHVDDVDRLLCALTDLRHRGARVAIDDVGSGYASMSLILHLHPDVIKLDVDLTHGIDGDPDRQALIASLIVFAQAIGSTIVAEGIETEDEARTLIDLGIHCGQGYLLGKPGEVSLHAAYARGSTVLSGNGTAFGLAAHVTALVDLAANHATYEPQRKRHVVKRVTVGALAALLLLGPASIAAAQSAQPGDALWGVRLRVEDFRLAIELDGAKRAVLLASFTDRRLIELQLLPADRRSLARPVVARYAAHLAELRTLASAADLRIVGPLHAQLASVLAHQRTAFTQLVASWCAFPDDSACPEARSALRSAKAPLQKAVQGQRDPGVDRKGGRGTGLGTPARGHEGKDPPADTTKAGTPARDRNGRGDAGQGQRQTTASRR